MDTILDVHNSKWAQSRMDKIPNRHDHKSRNSELTHLEMYIRTNVHDPQMDTLPIGLGILNQQDSPALM